MSIEQHIHQVKGFKSSLEKAVINLSYTAGLLDAEINAHLKQWDLSSQQYNILRILRGAGEALKVQTICERMIHRAPNMTRMVDKLILKKFVSRRVCEHDRRAIWVQIEVAGLKALSEIDNTLPTDVNSSKLKMGRSFFLNEQDATLLSNLLDKLRGENS